MSSFSFGTSYPATKKQPAQTAPVAAPVGAPAAPVAPAVAGAPDWLHEFLTKILGPALHAQNQNVAAHQQFQQDATFGRHLGMDGQPIASSPSTPLTFDQLRVPLADRVAKEQATFGASYTGGDRVMPTARAMSGTQRPPESFGATAREQGMMPPQNPTPTWGSPVYREQHPDFNMFQQQAYSTFAPPVGPLQWNSPERGAMLRRMF